MIRRSRISVRPNVKPTGRAVTGSRDASLDNTKPPETPADSAPSEGSEVTAKQGKTDPLTAASEPTNEKAALSSSHGNEVKAASCGEDAASACTDAQAAASTSMTSGPQRRKRFMALPNLAKPRVSPASTRTPKSPSKSPVKPPTPSESQKSTTILESVSGTSQVKKPILNPRPPGRPRPSGGGRQPKAQPTPAAQPQIDLEEEAQVDGASEETFGKLSQRPLKASQPDPVLLHENSPECPAPPALEEMVVQQENISGLDPEQSQSDPLGKEPEKQSSSNLIKSLKALNDPADMIRLAKARKLRELLKKEINKSKEDKKKPKMGFKERKDPKDPTKMTMRELIYYLPASNPMKSYTEEEESTSEIVLPSSPKPTSSTGPSVQETGAGDAGREEEEETERAEETQPEEEEPLLVPRVKVAEDGSLIVDEESLTVQVSRMKGPNLVEDRDPIFERGSTTTYSSFRKGTYTKPWSNGETDMFYLAISMVGTDFSMIGQLFPHRARVEIKNKFKKEERTNSWRIDKAFKEKRRLDLEFFKTLMEQMLKDEQMKKNKNKELMKIAKALRTQRKPRVAKRKEMESSEGSESDEVEGEKENEDVWNDGDDGAPEKHRGRAGLSHSISEEAAGDGARDFEHEGSEGPTTDDRLKEAGLSENVSRSPAQLKVRAQRPTPTLSNRSGNRCPAGEETKKSSKVSPTSIQEREKKQSSILHGLEDLEEEPDLTAVQEQIFNKPTRSGRIPKLSQYVMQAVEEEDEEELSDLPLSSKVHGQSFQAPGRRAKLRPGPHLKQGMTRRGKSRLVTLRASGTEDDDDDEEEAEECVLSQEEFSSNPEEENQAFVPMSLRPLPPVNSEVVETVEELDISVNVPDILGTSQNALCPELSCEQAQMPAGSVPCEHQLDLLVDVIEFLDPDHMEVCKEINNEAAHTLLTIGNSAQMIQAAEMPRTGENYIDEQSLSLIQEEVVQEEVVTETIEELQDDTSIVMYGPSEGCESEKKGDLELSSCGSHVPEPASEEPSTSIEQPIRLQTTNAEEPSTSIEQPIRLQTTNAEKPSTSIEQPIRLQTTNAVPIQDATQNSARSTRVPPSKRGRFSKPKPNVGQGLRTRRVQQQAPQELDSVESASGSSSTEQDKNTTEPIQEGSRSVEHTSQDSSIQPDISCEGREDGPDIISENMTDKHSGSPLLKRKTDDVIMEKSAKRDRRELEEARPEPQQTYSASAPPETSDDISRPVRKYRGPKPKPNLARTSRPTHTQQGTTSTTAVSKERPPAAKISTSTLTKRPEEGAVAITESDVSQGSTQKETLALNTESMKTVNEVTTQVVYDEDELKEKTVVVLEDTKCTPVENNLTQLPGCVMEDPSSDPASDEPVFILSLTEIPPTFEEGRSFGTEPLPPTTLPESHSHDHSANESREVSHSVITDALLPVAEEEESGGEDGDKVKKEDLKAPASASQRNARTESEAEHYGENVFVLENPEGKELKKPDKKGELPERTRRAKLQVKPNPVSRRNPRGIHAKEQTPALSSEKTTSLPISTPETSSGQEKCVPSPVSTTINSDNLTSAVISDKETTLSSSRDITALPTQSADLMGSHQLQDNTSKEFAEMGPPQSSMGQVDLTGKEAVELAVTESSSSDSQDVSQITPVATSGTLTRPGRRPKGFLSFISSKSTHAPPATQRGAKPGPQKPPVNTSRPQRKRGADSPVSTTNTPEVKRPTTTSASTSEIKEEEPTSVSKYFFSDIFTEVDELEDTE